MKSPQLVFDPSAWNKLFRRTHFDQVIGRFPERVLYEDMVASMSAFIHADKVAIHDAPIYWWRVRQDGSSITQDQSSWRNQVDRFEQLLQLNELLGENGLGEIKKWLDWKVLSLDLTYTHELQHTLDRQTGEQLFNETSRFLHQHRVSPDVKLRTGPERHYRALRDGDFDLYRRGLRRETSPMRVDRRPFTDDGARRTSGAKVLRVDASSTEWTFDLLVRRGLKSPQLRGTNPPPLAGGSQQWQLEAESRCPGWIRARVPSEVAAQFSGSTQLELSGYVDGEPVSGEIERSNLHRALSLGSKSEFSTHGDSVTTSFFEDAQLHLWSARPESVLHEVEVVDDEIHLCVRGPNAACPSWLLLAAVHDLDERTLKAEQVADETSIFVASRKQLRQAAYAMATLTDADDPCPTPLAAGSSALHHTHIQVGERGQAVLDLGVRRPHFAAQRWLAGRFRR